MTDGRRARTALYACTFLRALATGAVGVLLGLHLAARGLDPGEIGRVVGAGLAGGAAATLLATVAGDRIGRRRFLVAAALLGGLGPIAVAFADSAWAAGAAALLGMVNGMGRDRGASLVLEQAILPSTVPPDGRTAAFAWYNVWQDLGHALGGLLGAAPAALRAAAEVSEADALRAGLVAPAALLLATAALYRALPAAAAEAGVGAGAGPARLAPESRRIVARISALFLLDSVGGGFLAMALMALFFKARFGASEVEIGVLYFAARLANMLSHLAAARLARRIGLVNTMVFTHIPSSLLLVTVAFAPSFPVAAALFLLREGLVEMDVPTRQSYVMAVVRPEERTAASGITHLVRLAGWAVAPPFAGLFMKEGALYAPLVAGAALKIVYDVLLWIAFRKVKPPEEMRDSGH